MKAWLMAPDSVSNEFWEVYKRVTGIRDYNEGRFLSQLIKALIYLEKQNIIYKDIIKLKDKKGEVSKRM